MTNLRPFSSLTSTPSAPIAFSNASNLVRSGGDVDFARNGGGDGVRDFDVLAAVEAGACCCRLLSSPDCLLCTGGLEQ